MSDRTNERGGAAPVAGSTPATRLRAFLDQWPPPRSDDEIYRLYANDKEYSLRKSDIEAVLMDPAVDEQERIRSAFKQRCGLTFNQGSAMYGGHGARRCGLNKGHIGGCHGTPGTVSITRERLEEILNG